MVITHNIGAYTHCVINESFNAQQKFKLGFEILFQEKPGSLPDLELKSPPRILLL